MENQKSDTISTRYKDEGNKELMKNNLKDALLLYNKALRYAKSKEMLALIYANRSVIYLEEKLYDECLSNIQWARENGYPAEKIQKLNGREEKCKELKNSHIEDPVNDPWNFFKLTYPANPQIPFIADCLEMKKTKKFGRGIYATRDLTTGDIVAIENMVVHSHLDERGFELGCAFCSKGNQLNLIPCLKTTRYMFCSLDCRENCYAKIYEADLMNENHRMFVYARILIYLEDMFGGTDKLMKYLENKSNSKGKCSVFDFDFSNSNHPKFKYNLMKCFLSNEFPSHKHIIQTGKLLCKANAFQFATLARACNSIKVLKLIFVFTSSLSNTMSRYNAKGYPFANLLNHSCVPNVRRLEIDTMSVIYVTRPIKEGEQLFESYQFLNRHLDSLECGAHCDCRNIALFVQYEFKCDCFACTQGTPNNPQLVLAEVVNLLNKEKSLLDAIQQSDFKPALDELDNIHEIINENHERLAAFDVTLTQAVENKILDNIASKASHPYRYDSIMPSIDN